jgi:predicted Ser/Thr protein kinase
VQRDLARDAATVELARLDGYVLRERIGEGGMGVVHRATDARGRVVAVKLLRPHVAGDAESRARFAREAQVLARVRGRHVAQVLDADVAAASPYLVTDFVAGPPLHQVVERQGPLAGGDLADLAGDLADALCSIHAAGVVHRDLKPGNVLIEGGIAVVIDFGIAQIADDTRMTMPGLVYGTPGYVAPEILSGAEITPAADIHSWAATVAYAATGRSPFGKGPLEAVAFRVLHDAPDLDGAPDWLVPVLRACLAKEPTERPGAPALLRWLETGEPPSAGSGGAVALASGAVAGMSAANGLVTTPLSVPGAPAVSPDDVRTDTFDRYPGTSGTDAGEDDAFPYDAEQDDTYRDDSDLDDDYADDVGTEETYPDERYLDDDDAADDDAPMPESRWPAYVQPGSQHRVVTALAFATLASLASVLPAVAAISLAGWLVLARTVDRSALQVRRRRSARGRRPLDPVAVTLAMPWHALRSAVVTALTLPIAIVGTGILVGIVVLFFYAGAIVPRWDVLCGAAALMIAILSWWGIESEGVQRGSQRILSTFIRRRWVTIAAAGILAVATLLLLTAASTETIWWWPVEGLPTDQLDWPG